VYNSLPDYMLLTAATNIRFRDNYTLSLGIENLLDTDPPCRWNNADPTLAPTPAAPFQFAQACSHIGGGAGGDAATYDPLGRRFYISMSFEF
jgi:outer membrane receptor protein involved in Fe transport